MNRFIIILSVLITSFVLPKEAFSQISAEELVKQGRIYEDDGKDKEALKFYKQAAELNNPEGMFLYGDLLRLRSGNDNDKKEGYKWIEKAANAGYEEAIPIVGWIYFYGNTVWERDYSKALPYLIKAADYDAESSLLLGKMYFYGLGVEQDYNQALNYLLKSEYKWGETNYLLTQCYVLGLGTEPNQEKAEKYWNALVNDSMRDALFCIGHSFYYGVLTKQDYEQAVKYLQQSADKNYWPAQFLLSKCYRFGRGVKQDITKANELLEKAKYGDYDALLVSKLMKDN